MRVAVVNPSAAINTLRIQLIGLSSSNPWSTRGLISSMPGLQTSSVGLPSQTDGIGTLFQSTRTNQVQKITESAPHPSNREVTDR
jgi:hypothetical protein